MVDLPADSQKRQRHVSASQWFPHIVASTVIMLGVERIVFLIDLWWRKMNDPLQRDRVLYAADVEFIALPMGVVGNMHDVAAESVVVNATSHLRREP